MAPTRSAAPKSSTRREPIELSQVHFLALVQPGRDADFSGRVVVEPLALPVRSVATPPAAAASQIVQVVSPRELRRNRILSNLALADHSSDHEPSRLAQAREVIASTLDDDRLHDGVRRLGMGGDRLTLKF